MGAAKDIGVCFTANAKKGQGVTPDPFDWILKEKFKTDP